MGLRIKFSFRRFLFFTGTLEHDQEQWSNCRGRTMFSMQRLHEGGGYTIILQAQCLPRLWAPLFSLKQTLGLAEGPEGAQPLCDASGPAATKHLGCR